MFGIKRLGKAVTDFFFPLYCLGCEKEGDILCSACTEKLERIVPPFCSRCGLPSYGSVSCRDCAGLELAIDGIRSPLLFKNLTRKAIHHLKYQNLRVTADPLSRILYRYLVENPIETDCLVPVPLHPRRMRERGYNQSLLLANHLGRLAGLPVLNNLLERRINTPPQARTAGAAERHRNMKEAFTCENGKVKYKRVLLIDDVSTSGATLNACAVALKQAGATNVWGLTVAREV